MTDSPAAPSAATMLAVRKLMPYDLKSPQAALSVLRMTWPQCSPEAAETAFAIYRGQTKVTEVATEESTKITVTKLDGHVPDAESDED